MLESIVNTIWHSVGSALSWLGQFEKALPDFVSLVMAAFTVLLAVRFLLVPWIGGRSSDKARPNKKDKGDE